MKVIVIPLIVTMCMMFVACSSAIGIIIDTLGLGIDPNDPLTCHDNLPWTNANGDCDNDGIANGDDDFKFNSCASVDSDNDGNPDSLHDPARVSSCDLEINTLVPEDGSSPTMPTGVSGGTPDEVPEVVDSDDDGVPDVDVDGNPLDKFPTNACASLDTDGDGMPDTILVPGAPGTPTECEAADAVLLTEDMNDDGDTVDDISDNCPAVANSDQNNGDGDDFGDACDVDADNNGLINIRTIEDLNNVRYNLAGTSYKISADDSGSTDGAADSATTDCPSEASPDVYLCGYELMQTLDFSVASDYASGTIDMDWRPTDAAGTVVSPTVAVNAGFAPIGDNVTSFDAIFDGNDFTIRNLYINTRNDHVGLIRYVGGSGVVRNVGLPLGTVRGGTNIGMLAGQNDGRVTASWSKGSVLSVGNAAGGLIGLNNGTLNSSWSSAGVSSTNLNIGGLVGENSGTIAAVYAFGAVSASNAAGGLVGVNHAGGTITVAWASGRVSSGGINGGLVAVNSGMVVVSYWDSERTEQSMSAGSGATGLTSAQMRMDGGTFPDFSSFYLVNTNPFRLTAGQYPRLKAWVGAGPDSMIGTSDDVYSTSLISGQD